jgi:quercetin dioxygenase-like cupin family protein
MPFIQLKNLPVKELLPGFEGRMIHTENLTVAYFNIKAGSILPEHSHPHEQLTHVLQGQLEINIEGDIKIVEAGTVAVIPSNKKHSGRAITDCMALDVFQPVREDYKKLVEGE